MNGSDDQDFEKPGPVGRDPLTEGWKPGDASGKDGKGDDKK